MVSISVGVLVGATLIQFAIICFLVYSPEENLKHDDKSTKLTVRLPVVSNNLTQPQNIQDPLSISISPISNNVTVFDIVSIIPTPKQYTGVAVCLFLHSATWFQRRYTMMVRNIRSNLPDDWIIQIFYTAKGQSQNAIEINRGLQRMIENGQVLLSLIPEKINVKKKKQFELWTERWIWENMVADRILVFGGNSVLCGNSPQTVDTFKEWDYIGNPWNAIGGLGGGGGVGLRNRRAMLAVLDYELKKSSPEEQETSYKKWGQEDHFFVSRMLEMNKLGLADFKVASREATLRFSAIENEVNEDALAASGTLQGASYDVRESFMNKCLELKLLFPSLHDPHCFGAHPNAEECAKSICALQKDHKGGC